MKDVRIEEIMTRQVLFLTPEDTLLAARKLMDEHEIHHLPIVKNGQVKGVISSNDIAKIEYLAAFIGEKLDEESAFQSLDLHEIMSQDLYFLHSTSLVSEAIQVFSQANFHCLPIIDDGELVGIITSKDLFQHLVIAQNWTEQV